MSQQGYYICALKNLVSQNLILSSFILLSSLLKANIQLKYFFQLSLLILRWNSLFLIVYQKLNIMS